MTAAHLLQLRRRTAPPREAAAWFLAGADPAGWLAELCRWAVPLETLRCFASPGGLLVIAPAGSQRPAAARALALGAIAGKLYLPVDAELFPPVTDAEVGSLCRVAVTLFHPGIGLLEFAAEDAVGVWSLLAPAQFAAADWNSAQAGAALGGRLAGVALPALPALDEMFGDAKKDIGSEPVVRLPPRPGEPSAGAGGQIGRKLMGWGAAAVAGIFSMLPSGSARRTWVNDVLDWAAAKLGSVSKEVEELRNRELLRLLHLLDSDPDRGLRHALPLSGDPPRGRTPPGAHLGPRVVDFNLRNIGGGQPSDPWDVPWEMRRKLSARYRELALQEQQLGRFKRAAYIHAELLGDLSAAAAVLREGGHFAEAAVLYRDHLRQPAAAAECFVEAGLFAEAVAIYEKAGSWLELGDLHRRLGDEASATAAYRRLVEAKVAELDFLGAAGLLEDRLQAPDEALSLLGKGWPGAPQAVKCLAAEFALLGRLGRHGAAGQRLDRLRAEATPLPKVTALGEVLAGLRATYPDHGLRERAADLARIKISDRLARGDMAEVRAAAQIIARLAPEDRLLAGDTSRFLALRTSRMPPPTLPPPPPRKPGSGHIGTPTVTRTVPLPGGLRWIAVRRCGAAFLALTRQTTEAAFVRGNWQGEMQIVRMDSKVFPFGPLIEMLSADEGTSQPDFVIPLPVPGNAPWIREIPRTDVFPKTLRVGMPRWTPETTLTLAVSGSQWWILRIPDGNLLLEERSEDGRLVGNFDVSEMMQDSEVQDPKFSMAAIRSHVWIAIGTKLSLFRNGRVEREWHLESAVLGLEASAPFLPCAVLARCEFGVAVFWHDALSERVEMIASHLQRPRAVFLGNGTLILVSGVGDGKGCDGVAMDIDRRGTHSEAKFYKKGGTPVGLVATDRPDEFAIFDGVNAAQIWRVPVRR